MSEKNINRKSTTNDFTSGSPIKHIIRFAIPLVFGELGLHIL